MSEKEGFFFIKSQKLLKIDQKATMKECKLIFF